MTRTQLINQTIKANKYGSYLEIGLFDLNRNFNHIKCAKKVGVDPAFEDSGAKIFGCTSDTFFRLYAGKYDLIFIDGLHTYDQSYVDFTNALEHLNDNGCIVMHDCMPVNESETGDTKPANGKAWCGDVYKTMYDVMQVIDKVTVYPCDHGVGVIYPEGYQGALQSYDIDLIEYQESLSGRAGR